MGNCVTHGAAVSWADDEEEEEVWEWADSATTTADHHHLFDGSKKNRAKKEEDEREHMKELLTEKEAKATEVKIKMTKKQLDKLLSQMDAHGMPLQQLLAHLMAGSQGNVDHRDRHCWRPALQSIPEVAE